jgi:hypothetical protein
MVEGSDGILAGHNIDDCEEVSGLTVQVTLFLTRTQHFVSSGRQAFQHVGSRLTVDRQDACILHCGGCAQGCSVEDAHGARSGNSPVTSIQNSAPNSSDTGALAAFTCACVERSFCLGGVGSGTENNRANLEDYSNECGAAGAVVHCWPLKHFFRVKEQCKASRTSHSCNEGCLVPF